MSKNLHVEVITGSSSWISCKTYLLCWLFLIMPVSLIYTSYVLAKILIEPIYDWLNG